MACMPTPIWLCSIAAGDAASLDTSAGCSLTLHTLLTGSCGVAADVVLSDRQSGSEAACQVIRYPTSAVVAWQWQLLLSPLVSHTG